VAIMPTMAKRRRWIPQAIKCFQRQTYPRKSLLVVSEDDLGSILPADVGFVHTAEKHAVGTKRNVACEYAEAADIICHWDDDDWSAPTRIAEQVETLTEDMTVQLVGYREMPFIDLNTGLVWHWRGTGGDMCGTSMCYRREHWKRLGFTDVQIGEDVTFTKMTRAKLARSNNGQMVARFHSDSVTASTAKFGSGGWTAGQWADLPDGFRRLSQ